ncbi:hypothetical protein LTSEADE_1482, partial [Salmonella enterica subsp. enterica serovar Adelaide str. A4-669]
ATTQDLDRALKKLIDVEKIFPYISARSSNAGATIW